MSLLGTSSVNDLPNITGSADSNFDNITATNISVSNKLLFEEADATDEGNMTTYIFQDPSTNDIVVNNNNPLGSFRLQYGNTPNTNVLSFEIDSYNQKLNLPVGVNPEYNISFEELYALKGVNINQSIQQQINGLNQLSLGIGYWGTFFSTIDQTFATADTAQIATLNNSDPNNNGIILFNQSGANYNSIKILNGATYNFQIVFQVSSTSSSTGLVRSWIRLNGTDLPNSSAGIKEHSNNGYLIISYNLILQLIPNDVITFMIAGSNTAVHLEAIPAQASPFACPASPSVYISVQQITYYQKAELQNIYGLFQTNTVMTQASPNFVAVMYQAGFTTITLPRASETPLGKEFTFFMVNQLGANAVIFVGPTQLYDLETVYYYGNNDTLSINLNSQVQSFVFTLISQSAEPQWALSQVEYNPNNLFNLSTQNTVSFSTTFNKQGSPSAIILSGGSTFQVIGNILASGATITPVELSYLDATTSNIQGQLTTLQTKTTQLAYSNGLTYTSGNFEAENITAQISFSIGGTNIGLLYGSYSDVATLNQKTTQQTFDPTWGNNGGRTNFSYDVRAGGSLYTDNYIFIGNTDINQIYSPRAITYTKTECNNLFGTAAAVDTIATASALNTAAIALYILGVPPNPVPVFFGIGAGLNNAFPLLAAAYIATAATVGIQGTAIGSLETKTQYQSVGVSSTNFSGVVNVSSGSTTIKIFPEQNKIISNAGQNLTLESPAIVQMVGTTVNTLSTGATNLISNGAMNITSTAAATTITSSAKINLNSTTGVDILGDLKVDNILGTTVNTLSTGSTNLISNGAMNITSNGGATTISSSAKINLNSTTGVDILGELKVDTILGKTGQSLTLLSGSVPGSVFIGSSSDFVFINNFPISAFLWMQWSGIP